MCLPQWHEYINSAASQYQYNIGTSLKVHKLFLWRKRGRGEDIAMHNSPTHIFFVYCGDIHVHRYKIQQYPSRLNFGLFDNNARFCYKGMNWT